MTDGSIYISELVEHFTSFNVKDSLAIELLRVHGDKLGVISGKCSSSLIKRCQVLEFDVIEAGCKNKLTKLREICERLSINNESIAFCGGDVLDVPIMCKCGLSASPNDAYQLAIDTASWVYDKKGGQGFVRDFVDNLLMSQINKLLSDLYQPLLDKIEADDVEGLEQ